MQTVVGQNWDKVDSSIAKGPLQASRKAMCLVQLKEFCEDCVRRSEFELQDKESRYYWHWPEMLRDKAASVDHQAYKREYSKQQYHWRKLVHEMRQL